MRKPIDYRVLFSTETTSAQLPLARELGDLLAVRPAPEDYRENLRSQLLAAARDENFYRRAISRRLLLAMSVVVTVLLSVVGLIAWRNHGATLPPRAR